MNNETLDGSPEAVVAHWKNMNARVEDEVKRILGLLREQKPFTARPAHFGRSGFQIVFPGDASKICMEQVVQAFKALGWNAELGSNYSMGATYYLALNHPLLEELSQSEHIRTEGDSFVVRRRGF